MLSSTLLPPLRRLAGVLEINPPNARWWAQPGASPDPEEKLTPWQRRDFQATTFQSAKGLAGGPGWGAVYYRTTYDVASGVYLESCRPVEEIDKAQHKHADLGLTGPDVWTPDPPRDIVTTLWGERIELESEEFRVCVSESSVLGPDLSRPKPPTRSAEAPKSYHIVEAPGEIDLSLIHI